MLELTLPLRVGGRFRWFLDATIRLLVPLVMVALNKTEKKQKPKHGVPQNVNQPFSFSFVRLV